MKWMLAVGGDPGPRCVGLVALVAIGALVGLAGCYVVPAEVPPPGYVAPAPVEVWPDHPVGIWGYWGYRDVWGGGWHRRGWGAGHDWRRGPHRGDDGPGRGGDGRGRGGRSGRGGGSRR